MIRVLLADDQELVRSGFSELNDAFTDTAWGILGIVTIIAAVLLLVVPANFEARGLLIT